MRAFLSRSALWALLGAVYLCVVGSVRADIYEVAAKAITVTSPPPGFVAGGDWYMEIVRTDTGGTPTGGGTICSNGSHTGFTFPAQDQLFPFQVSVHWFGTKTGGGTGRYYYAWYAAKDLTGSNPDGSFGKLPAETSGNYGSAGADGTNNYTSPQMADGGTPDQYGNEAAAPAVYKMSPMVVKNSGDVARQYNLAMSRGGVALDPQTFTLQPGQSMTLNLTSDHPDNWELSHMEGQNLESGGGLAKVVDGSGTLAGQPTGTAPPDPVATVTDPSTSNPTQTSNGSTPPAQTQTGTGSTGASQADITHLDTDLRNSLNSEMANDNANAGQAHKDANNIAGALEGSSNNKPGGDGTTADGTLGTGTMDALTGIPGKIGTIVSDLGALAGKSIPTSGGGASTWNFYFPIGANSYLIDVDQVSWFFPWIRGITLAIAVYMFIRALLQLSKGGFATS